MDGVINVFKPAGMTSHDVVAYIRKQLGIKRVGHTGTLDPDAEGVLPICVGKATKIAEILTAEKKGYRAEMTLGKTTDTQDGSGKNISQVSADISLEIIVNKISHFVGNITQLPPMFSAVKINGMKLYQYARKGIEVERVPRNITIHSIKVLNVRDNFVDGFNNPLVDLAVVCSKGTYIRTLCHDIGQALGCGAHMSKLLRTQSGDFFLDDSITLEGIRDCCRRQDYKFIIPIGNFFKTSVVVPPDIERRVVCGNNIPAHAINARLEEKQIYSVYNQQDKLLCLSLAVKEGEKYFLKLYKSFY